MASLWSLVVGLGYRIILHPPHLVTSLATSNLWMETFGELDGCDCSKVEQ